MKGKVLERDTEGVKGWITRKGVFIPSRIRSLGNVVSSPSKVLDIAATENEFGYSTAVSITLVTIIC